MITEVLVSMGAGLVSGLGSSLAGFGISKFANSHFKPENPEDDDQVKKANRKKTSFTIVGSSLASAAICTGVSFAASAIAGDCSSSSGDDTDAGSDGTTSTDTSDGDVSDTDTSELR